MTIPTLAGLLDAWRRPANDAPAVSETLPLRIATMLLLQRSRQNDHPVTDDAAVEERNALARLLAGHAPVYGRRLWISALERVPTEALANANYEDGGTRLSALDASWMDLRIAYADFRTAAQAILLAC